MHPSSKTTVPSSDGANEAKEEAVLQRSLHVPYVRPPKVLAALEWLRANNPLYRNVKINSDWLDDAALSAQPLLSVESGTK